MAVPPQRLTRLLSSGDLIHDHAKVVLGPLLSEEEKKGFHVVDLASSRLPGSIARCEQDSAILAALDPFGEVKDTDR